VIGLLTAIPAVAQTPSVKTQTVSIKLSSPTGDTDITDTNSRGMVSVADYSVLVSSKKMVGDGYCSIGDTCWIVDLLDSRGERVRGGRGRRFHCWMTPVVQCSS
jgi:hypothetical protein